MAVNDRHKLIRRWCFWTVRKRPRTSRSLAKPSLSDFMPPRERKKAIPLPKRPQHNNRTQVSLCQKNQPAPPRDGWIASFTVSLLTYGSYSGAPSRDSSQWHLCVLVPKYSSGTAPDLHRLPFSIRLYRRIPQKAFYKLVWVYHRKQRFSTLCFPSLNSYKTYVIIEIYRRYNCSNENFH